MSTLLSTTTPSLCPKNGLSPVVAGMGPYSRLYSPCFTSLFLLLLFVSFSSSRLATKKIIKNILRTWSIGQLNYWLVNNGENEIVESILGVRLDDLLNLRASTSFFFIMLDFGPFSLRLSSPRSRSFVLKRKLVLPRCWLVLKGYYSPRASRRIIKLSQFHHHHCHHRIWQQRHSIRPTAPVGMVDLPHGLPTIQPLHQQPILSSIDCKSVIHSSPSIHFEAPSLSPSSGQTLGVQPSSQPRGLQTVDDLRYVMSTECYSLDIGWRKARWMKQNAWIHHVFIPYVYQPWRIFGRANASEHTKYALLPPPQHPEYASPFSFFFFCFLSLFLHSEKLTPVDYAWTSRQSLLFQPSVAVAEQSFPHVQPLPSSSFPTRYNTQQSSHLQGYYHPAGLSQQHLSAHAAGRVYQPRRYVLCSFSLFLNTSADIKLTLTLSKSSPVPPPIPSNSVPSNPPTLPDQQQFMHS